MSSYRNRYFYHSYHIKRKEAARLAGQVDELSEQKAELSDILEATSEAAHRQRLEAIGTIASKVNHEYSNLLTPIMGYSLLAMEKVPEENDELMEYLEKIYDSSTQAKNLVTQLLKFSHKDNGEYTYCSPDHIIEKTLSTLRFFIHENITVHTDFNCSDKCLYANPSQISQVISNLVGNSIDALKDKQNANIYISTGHANDHICITVEDDGPGISENILPHIFESFYTTKNRKGTGLGLPIIKQIVETHHGRLLIENNPGKGIKFTVELPAKA